MTKRFVLTVQMELVLPPAGNLNATYCRKVSNVAPPRGTCLRIEEEKGQRPAGIEPTISLNELVVLVLLIKPDS